jgi:hypothetical protein
LCPGGCGRRPVEQILHGPAHCVEAAAAEELAPVLLDLGDPVTGVVEQLSAVPGWEDQLRPPVARIWTASRALPDSPRWRL